MKRGLLAILAFLIVLSIPTLASVTSVTTTSSATRATTGTSVTISVTVTASESETTSIQLISSPEGVSISDPASGSYSTVAVGTTPVTKTFTITAGTANTYTYYAQAGTPPVTSTSANIVFEDPSVFTVSGSPSSVSKSSGETFTLSVTITNTQANSITSSYALSLPSGYSASGDPTSGTVTVAAGSSTTFSWTVTTGSSSGTIYFQLGDNTNAFSSSVSITSEGAAPSGGTTGGVVAGVSAKTVDLTSELKTEESYQSSFSKGDKLTYEFAEVNHTITIAEVTNITVTLTIASDPYNITLSIGETKNVDLDGDGVDDLAITLNSITDLTANLTFTRLGPPPKPVPECPVCPEPSEWSECFEGEQVRTIYGCGAETNYTCQAYTETQDCEVEVPLPPIEVSPVPTAVAVIVVLAIIAGGIWFFKREKALKRKPWRRKVKFK